MLIKVIILILISILNLLNIMLIGLPIVIDILVLIIFIILFHKNKKLFFIYNFLILFSIIFINTFVLNFLTVKNNNISKNKSFFYNNKYKSNIDVIMKNPVGDLIALDTCTKNIKNYRTIIEDQKFITDNYGYRNRLKDIIRSNYILVGDSFIMGSILSQDDIISEKLNKKSKFKFSNIAVGGTGPETYEKNIKDIMPKINENSKFLIFYFEGNDFDFNEKKNYPFYWYGIKIDKYKYKIRFGYERLERNKDKFFNKEFFNKNKLFKYVRPSSQRLYNGFLSKWTNSCLVEWNDINNQKIGFLYKYFEINNYKTYIIKDIDILKKIDKIFFIPTKYSTYEKYLKSNLSELNRKNKFNYLKNEYSKLNLEVIDLTTIFQNEAEKLLKKNQFIYFNDDTHLNKLGSEFLSNYLYSIYN